MKIQFFGKAGAIPEAGEDCPCFLINDKYMFDLGLHAPMSLINYGIDPASLEITFFTHMHHDHFLGLPMLMFIIMQSGHQLSELTLAGPAGTLQSTVENSIRLCCDGRFYLEKGEPRQIPLLPGDVFETDEFVFETHASDHAVEGLCYRVTEKASGKVLGITGDTCYTDDIADFFGGCDAIIHEATVALEKDTRTKHNHSGVYDALDTARRAGCSKLFLVHTAADQRARVLDVVAKSYDGEALYPEFGGIYEI